MPYAAEHRCRNEFRKLVRISRSAHCHVGETGIVGPRSKLAPRGTAYVIVGTLHVCR